MKRYKVEYWDIDRSKPSCLTKFAKSEILDGVLISFSIDGRKNWKAKYKNDLLNGIKKIWWYNTKNVIFSNWKKNKGQGIQIGFNQ